MKRKYLLLIVGTMTAYVGLALGALAMLPERPGVSKANFDRVKKGMTRAEAEAIFGMPASCYGQHWGLFSRVSVHWKSDDGARADFDLNNEIGIIDSDGTWTPSTETINEKFRRWLRSCFAALSEP